MSFLIKNLDISGAFLISNPVFSDSRGFFREWFKTQEMCKFSGFRFELQQANLSKSKLNSIRGIHFTNTTDGQAKIITCANGRMVDLIIDLRIGSPTYLKHIFVNLSDSDGCSIFLSEGLGHGFLSLEDATIVTYLVNKSYMPEKEYSLNPFDEEIGIAWNEYGPVESFILSEKDKFAPKLVDLRNAKKLPIYVKS